MAQGAKRQEQSDPDLKIRYSRKDAKYAKFGQVRIL